MLKRISLFYEIVVMAFKSIFSNKMRSFLTTFGILIGVMTVIAMVSVIEGLNISVKKDLESIGSSIIFVSRFEPGIRFGRMPSHLRRRKPLTLDEYNAVKSIKSIKAISPELYQFGNISVKYRNNRAGQPIIVGVSEDYLNIFYFNIEEGRFFTHEEVQRRANVCVLASQIAESLFPSINPIGKKILIDGRKYVVVGVVEKMKAMFGSNRNNLIIIPYTTFSKYYPWRRNIRFVAIPKSADRLQETIDDIVEVLRIKRKVKADEDNNFAIFTQETLSSLWTQLTGGIFFVMILIASISLLVGGIGVMNIMLVTVKERTREIGIRMAIGAKRKDILWQFLVESVSLTLTGGILGILFGFSIGFGIKKFSSLPATVTLWSVGVGILMAVSVGLFFGIYPAWKAAKLNPIDALRYE